MLISSLYNISGFPLLSPKQNCYGQSRTDDSIIWHRFKEMSGFVKVQIVGERQRLFLAKQLITTLSTEIEAVAPAPV